MVSAVPVLGQLVDVRSRRFVVVNVLESDIPGDPLASSNEACREHLVSLSSVEDDGMGEELQVIWEIEPGAQVYEKAALPDVQGFDPPRRLDAFLDALRWGAVASADHRSLHSPFRSGISIEDYQLDPVVRCLQMPRANLLIADDVGLGKTIEAGLVVQELLLRHRARSVLVVCPAGLQIQWRDQMRDKFGLEFRIVNSETMKTLRRQRGLFVNPWTHFPRLITSIDFLKREQPLRQFREVLPPEGEPAFPRKFDIMIVDEAHNVAPSGGIRYKTDSARTQAIRLLAPHFEHKLFLSATPHNGYTESFSSLLELLDNQRFHRGVPPEKRQLATVMVRRLKSELPPRWDGKARFAKRVLDALEVNYSEQEREAHQLLTEYAKLRTKQAKDGAQRVATEFVLKLLKKRMFSSPAAFLTTLEKHRETLRNGTKKKSVVKASSASLRILKQHIAEIEEDYANDETYEDATIEVVDSTSRVFEALSTEEETLLDQLIAWASTAAARPDAKAERLLKWVKQHVKPDGKWGTQRVIIFTEYRATQKWLFEILAASGLAKNGRLDVLYGGMNSDEREAVKAAFQANPEDSNVRILLATDAASEGIDLQNHCAHLIHNEIPWNPNRLEQRNGRIDRHGQRAEQVHIFHFVGAGYEQGAQGRKPGDLEGDLEFLLVAANKVESIREDLGKVGPVIAEQVTEAMLGQRTRLQTTGAEREASGARALLKIERKLREDIERLRGVLDDSRKTLRLSAQNVLAVVETGLALAKQLPLEPTEVKDIWPATGSRYTECPVFRVPHLTGSWLAATEGLAHPHTGEVRPVVFDHDLAEGRDDVVLVHLNHRLVQMCLRLLRAEVWSPDRKLHRVTARVVPRAALETPAIIAHGRMILLGGDNTRLHEEVIAAGGRLVEGKFKRLNVGETKQCLQAATDGSVGATMEATLTELWPQHQRAVHSVLEARMKDRTKSMQKVLEDRAVSEASDVQALLTELQETLEAQLKEAAPAAQVEFDFDERSQFERDRSSISERLAKIPDEIQRETLAIEARYAELTSRLFPVSITFLVPSHLAGQAVH